MANFQSLAMIVSISTVTAVTISILGCASQDVAPASSITLDNAMQEVGRSVVDAKIAERDEATNKGLPEGWNQGTILATWTATFNIAASQNNSNNLFVSASTPTTPVVPVVASGGGGFSSAAAGNRGNQVTVVYQSLYFNPTGGAATHTNSVAYSTNITYSTTNALANATNIATQTGTASADKPATGTTSSTNGVSFSTNYALYTNQTVTIATNYATAEPSNLNPPDRILAIQNIMAASETNGSGVNQQLFDLRGKLLSQQKLLDAQQKQLKQMKAALQEQKLPAQ